jgi:hypothetical protein
LGMASILYGKGIIITVSNQAQTNQRVYLSRPGPLNTEYIVQSALLVRGTAFMTKRNRPCNSAGLFLNDVACMFSRYEVAMANLAQL